MIRKDSKKLLRSSQTDASEEPMINKIVRWDLFIIMIAIYNSIEIPYTIAFSKNNDDGVYGILLNLFFDSLFIMDIFINFRTSYLDIESGVEVVSTKLIFLQYMKGRFWIDLIASLPTDILLLIFEPSQDFKTFLTLLKLLKLIRLTKLSKVITYLNLKADVKVSLRLGQLIFYLILYLHLTGCFWFYIAENNQQWIPPYYEFSDESNIYVQNQFTQYVTSLYYSVLLLAGNDMLPQGNLQIVYATLMLFAAAIINANIFGNIAVLLQQIYRKSNEFQEKLENATSTMKNLNIPEDLSKKIQEFLTTTQSTLSQQNEFDAFLSQLSPSLKIEVTKHIFQESLYYNSIFEK